MAGFPSSAHSCAKDTGTMQTAAAAASKRRRNFREIMSVSERKTWISLTVKTDTGRRQATGIESADPTKKSHNRCRVKA